MSQRRVIDILSHLYSKLHLNVSKTPVCLVPVSSPEKCDHVFFFLSLLFLLLLKFFGCYGDSLPELRAVA